MGKNILGKAKLLPKDSVHTYRSGIGYFDKEKNNISFQISDKITTPFTVPIHRIALKENNGYITITDKYYRNRISFGNDESVVNYPISSYVTVSTKEKMEQLIRYGYNKITIIIETPTKANAKLAKEENEATVTAKANMAVISKYKLELMDVSFNNAYTLKEMSTITNYLNIYISFKRSMKFETVEDIIKSIFVYHFLFFETYDFKIKKIIIGNNETSTTYNMDYSKYSRRNAQNKMNEDVVKDLENIKALQQIVSIYTVDNNHNIKYRSAIEQFLKILLEKGSLENGCVLLYSILDKITPNGKMENKKAAKKEIKTILKHIENSNCSEEVKGFYLKDPNEIIQYMSRLPFKEKVEKYCASNGIPFNKKDREALSWIDKYRNQIIHGKISINEIDINNYIESKSYIKMRKGDGGKQYLFSYKVGAFQACFGLLKNIIKYQTVNELFDKKTYND